MPKPDSLGDQRMRALAAELPSALQQGFAWGRELSCTERRGVSPCLRGRHGRFRHRSRPGTGNRGIRDPLVARGSTRTGASQVGRRALHRDLRQLLWEHVGDRPRVRGRGTGRGPPDRYRIGRCARRPGRGGWRADPPDPPGLPPRSAVGHLLGGILGLLDSAFPESNETRVERVADHVRSLIGQYGRASGPAAALAEGIADRLPFVYAESGFLALARRWKTQIEENAKRVAAFDEVPELFHNSLVGWDATGRTEASRLAVVLLEWSGEDPGGPPKPSVPRTSAQGPRGPSVQSAALVRGPARSAGRRDLAWGFHQPLPRGSAPRRPLSRGRDHAAEERPRVARRDPAREA